MTNIPDELVLGCIEDIVQGYGQVSHTQTSPKMSSSAADIVDDVLAQLLAKLFQLPPVEILDVYGVVDSIQQRCKWFVVCGWVKVLQLINGDLVKSFVPIAGAVVSHSAVDRSFDCLNMEWSPTC